jgi:hypothetical protein
MKIFVPTVSLCKTDAEEETVLVSLSPKPMVDNKENNDE